jgi:hypothetical protein
LHYVGIAIYLLHIFSYSYTALVNPGIPNKRNSTYNLRPADPSKRNIKICDICHIVMDEDKKIVHCEDCGVCIEGNIQNTKFRI